MWFTNHKSQRSWSWGFPTTSHKEVGHEVSRPQVTEELVMGFPTTSHKGDGHGFWFTLRFWILYPGAFTCKNI